MKKKFFKDKLISEKEKKENDENGRFMRYRHAEQAREVSQSKERQKLGWGQKMSYGR